jgi:hypothetical protein
MIKIQCNGFFEFKSNTEPYVIIRIQRLQNTDKLYRSDPIYIRVEDSFSNK